MRRLGIADLGSNTARLLVFDFEPGRWYHIADGIRESVRLGEGLGAGDRLSDEAIDRAVAALELFADYARARGLEGLEVIATSAVRDGANRDRLLARLAGLPLSLRVVSGAEEAELAVAAVANGFAQSDAWIVDLGGGSAQLARMEGRHCVRADSFPVGALRACERFLQSDPPRVEEVAAYEEDLEARLGRAVRRLRKQRGPLIAIGGTARSLARLAQHRERYPLPLLHGYELRRDTLDPVVEQLLGLRRGRRTRLAGLGADRAGLIVAGAVFYRWLLRAGGRKRLLISGQGVREGAFYRHFLPAPHLLPDVGSFAVANLLAGTPGPAPDRGPLQHLARQLFDALAPLHGGGEDEARLLATAIELSGIGAVVDAQQRDLHGHYLLTHLPLCGFGHREQALIALLVRYQRRGTPKLGLLASLCLAGDQRRLLQLTACLRLADALERSRSGRVVAVEVEVGERVLRLRLRAAETPTVELWEAQNHASLVEAAFGRRLKLSSAALSRDPDREV